MSKFMRWLESESTDPRATWTIRLSPEPVDHQIIEKQMESPCIAHFLQFGHDNDGVLCNMVKLLCSECHIMLARNFLATQLPQFCCQSPVCIMRSRSFETIFSSIISKPRTHIQWSWFLVQSRN